MYVWIQHEVEYLRGKSALSSTNITVFCDMMSLEPADLQL
jgi:hypothetical protein